MSAINNNFVSLDFEAYGVYVRLRAESEHLLDTAKQVSQQALVNCLDFVETGSRTPELTFSLTQKEDRRMFVSIGGVGDERERGGVAEIVDFSRFLNSMIRIYVAERAKRFVFIHAGVVGWKDRTIVIPGASYQGKTTLVGELIRIGAEYYSDEYAVIDETGLVHPFPRKLSFRVDETQVPVETDAWSMGATVAEIPSPVGCVLITSYQPDGVWKPDIIGRGAGILEIIPQVIPIKYNPEFSLKVLNTAFSRAIIVKTTRGDARQTAEKLLEFFDNCLYLGTIL